MNRHCAVVPVLVGLLLLSAPAVAQAPGKLTGSSVKPILESIRLQNLEGEVMPLASYLGPGPLVIDFWATWCKPCLAAMPELEKLYTDYRDRGLQVIGINEDGPRNAGKVKPFLRSHGYTFPVLLDLNHEAQRRLHAIALPTTLVLDAEGKVLHSSFGYRPGEIDKLRSIVEPLLLEKADE